MAGKWSTVTPGEITGDHKANLAIGPFGSNLKNSDFTADGVPLVFVRDIRAADFSRPRAYVTPEKANELRAHIALPGDVLITKMGDPPGDACLYTGPKPAIITADCIRLRPSAQFDAAFIAHALRTPRLRHQILSITTGAAQQKVSLDRFRNGVKFDVPPLEEQRRIARILDQADVVRSKRRQMVAHLNTLSQSIFNNMFNNLDAKGNTVGAVAEIQGGLQISSKRAGLPHEVPYLRVANSYRGRLNLSEVKHLNATEAEVERTKLKRGDLLFVEGHANPKEVGRVATWSCELELCVHQNHLIRARLDHSRALPIFVESWLNSNRGAEHFWRAGKTTSGLNTISTKVIRDAPLPLPSIEMQREFAAQVEQVEAQRAVVQRALDADNELFASLQSVAFRGEI
jgi:type I restriction enzyme S subunit